MSDCRISFFPQGKSVTVPTGTSLLEAAGRAGIVINSVCGGDGICGRCKMIVKRGEVRGATTPLLTRDEIRNGVVLGCMSHAEGDVAVLIPDETAAAEKVHVDEDAQRFRAMEQGITRKEFRAAPLVSKVLLKLDNPTLEDNEADTERVKLALVRESGIAAIQIGLKTVRTLPAILRENGFEVTALIGRRGSVTELMDVQGGDTTAANYLAVVDVGTSTIVAHLVDAVSMRTVDAQACFNSQSVYGREVTARIMAAEEHGTARLQELIVADINGLVSALAERNGIAVREINAMICAGNTTMTHFLLGLPTDNIRRTPYIAASNEPAALRAAEVGLKINARGLLYAVPGISGWVGGDITAGILATGLHEMDGVAMLLDVGTNGEIVIGNRDWLVACSASTGPALEGASVRCGMMAERGAIERVAVEDGALRFKVIGNGKPRGLCGSAIIDLVACLLELGAIDRAGKFVEGGGTPVRQVQGIGRYALVPAGGTEHGKELFVDQNDIDNVITAKAAVFAATKIMLDRFDLKPGDITKLFIAGGFGGYIDRKNAVSIGLIPDLPVSKIEYAGNTSVWGATLAALSEEALEELGTIRRRTTYLDLMGTTDYVEQFQQAMFLPHTNIELFPSVDGSSSKLDG